MQLISPRKVEHWSQTYKERFAKLEKTGLVHQSGINSVEDAKKSGLWNFMDDVDNLIIPEDLQFALTQNTNALNFFNALSKSNKRFTLRYLKLSKTETTRQKRINQIVELAAQNRKVAGL